jgi:hypothetical protein
MTDGPARFKGGAAHDQLTRDKSVTDQASRRRTALGRGSSSRADGINVTFPKVTTPSACPHEGTDAAHDQTNVTDRPRRARPGGQSDE